MARTREGGQIVTHGHFPVSRYPSRRGLDDATGVIGGGGASLRRSAALRRQRRRRSPAR